MNGISRHVVALCQRPPAHSPCIACNLTHLVGERYVVPRHICLYVVGRHTILVELHLHRTCRIVYTRHEIGKFLLVESSYGLIAQVIITQRTDSNGVESHLLCVKREVCRCTAKRLSFRQHIP